MSREINARCTFCRRPMAMSPLALEQFADAGDEPTCWICIYATDVGEDERVRTSSRVFQHVHAEEIAEAYEQRARLRTAHRASACINDGGDDA